MKHCKKCGAQKAEHDFYPRNATCKDCVKAAVRANYARNREHYREYERSRNNLPHRVEARNQYLQTERIPIISEDVLDIYPRKLVFFPSTGKAMVKRLGHSYPEELLSQEYLRGNAAAVARRTSGGSVDLF